MDNVTIFIIGGILILIIGVIISKNFAGSFKGLKIKKTEGKDNVSISKIQNDSEIDVNTQKGQNLNIEEVNKSTIKINKDKKT